MKSLILLLFFASAVNAQEFKAFVNVSHDTPAEIVAFKVEVAKQPRPFHQGFSTTQTTSVRSVVWSNTRSCGFSLTRNRTFIGVGMGMSGSTSCSSGACPVVR